MPGKPVFSKEPEQKKQYTQRHDQFYTGFAGAYDLFVKRLPTWRNWLRQATPHIQGPRVLEVSFGTGYLLTQMAGQFETYGIDYNHRLAELAKKNLSARGTSAQLQIAEAAFLPYPNNTFDTVVNTMAFSGYPDGMAALAEMHRVLRKWGKLILIDVSYPANRNWIGTLLTRFWAFTGDIIRDMGPLLGEFYFDYTDQEIGGFGSVHLYLATKR